MAILKTDIKLMASERLTDFDDGGGSMTGNEIISGELNNLFPDISRLDRTYGRVSLRKCFPSVVTANQDMYYGSHAIVTDPPADDNVFVTMFSRGDFDDVRSDAQDKIESYVTIAGQTLLRPMYDQLEGQRSIVCFQSVGNPVPEIGETIVIKSTGTGDQQYVRITGISTVRTTFQNANSTFAVDVVTIDLSAALAYTFKGIDPTPYSTLADARIHNTIVSDASKYYGVSKVVQSISQSDFNIWVDSIYNQLVPTSQIESPVVDQFMGGDTFTYYPKGDAGSLTYSATRNQDTGLIHLPDGLMKGSLSITIAGYDFKDDGDGGLVPVIDGNDGGFEGTVDYASGQVNIEKSSWSGTVSLSATPCVPIVESYETAEIQIELTNRAYNYTPMLTDPLPQPGNIYVDYMAQGKWYRLFDDGNGVFTSKTENVGTGTVDYATGSCVITLGALPDVGSSIIFSWGAGVEILDKKAEVTATNAVYNGDLGQLGIIKGSVTISWDDGTPRSVTDDANGDWTGDGDIVFNYADGTYFLTPNPIPDVSVTFTEDFDYDTGANTKTYAEGSASYSGPNSENANFTIPGAPIEPMSVKIHFTVDTVWSTTPTEYAGVGDKLFTYTRTAYDDGTGGLQYDGSGSVIGSIDYATGVVSLLAKKQFNKFNGYWVSVTRSSYGTSHSYRHVYYNTTSEWTDPPSLFSCNYRSDAAATAATDSNVIAADYFKVKLIQDLSGTDGSVVPNSVVFTMDGSTFYDTTTGELYKDKDPVTGIGTYAGTINYATSEINITGYDNISTNFIVVQSLLVKNQTQAVSNFTFRTPGAPIRQGSMSVRGTSYDGTLYTSVSATNGDIVDTGIIGTVDYDNGVVRLRYGFKHVAAGNELEDWYDADAIEDDGTIFLPSYITPETALYNAVYYSTLPLDATIVGIEPIRLPTDGRVPIFKSGDVVVLHHTESESIGNTFTSAQVITLSRAALSIVDLYDYQGNLIPEDDSKFLVDLDNGTITIVDDGTYLNGYTNGNAENVVCNHRIEDMLLLSEAQINGFLTTVGPITHDYPATGAQLSTALIFGDLAGRVVRLFTQKTWDGVYRDYRSGDDSTAKYDTVNYPFVITNDGSADQRWVLKFTSSSTVDVIGETFGVILSGANIANTIAPTNPATGNPYFTISPSGWGSGWATGNNIRFDTTAANYPVWIARTTMQGPVTDPTDNFVMQIRGDAN